MRELARAAPSSFHVVVPATPPRDHIWTEGEARATARSRLDAALARFLELGAEVEGRSVTGTRCSRSGTRCATTGRSTRS